MLKNAFVNPDTGDLRSGWQVFIFFLLVAICQTSALEMFFTWFQKSPLNSNQTNQLWIMLITRGLALIVCLIISFICVRMLARRPVATLGYSAHRGWWRDLLLGHVVAFVMIAIVVAMQLTSGGSKLSWQPPPVGEMLRWTALQALVFLVAASLEEVIFRGYPLQAFARSLPPLSAALIMSLPFGFGHITNPNAATFSTINTVLAGLFLCVAYFKTRSLWLATGLHTGWNFTMGAIFGMPVSGITSFAKYAPFHHSEQGVNWLTGGSYGPEGGLSSTIILIVATYWLLKTSWFSVSPELAAITRDMKLPKVESVESDAVGSVEAGSGEPAAQSISQSKPE